MHPCLHISEIVENILEKADVIQLKRLEGSWSPKGMSSPRNPVLAMALCCKAFHRMAIAIMWKELPDLNYLYQCFPEDVWSEVGARSPIHDRYHTEYFPKFKRPPRVDEWDNVLLYARNVWYLTAHMDSSPDMDIQYLGLFRPPVLLFPNIRRIEWSATKGAVIYLHILMAPMLEILISNEEALPILSHWNPPLRELYIQPSGDTLGESGYTHLSGLRSLRKFDSGYCALSVLDLMALSGLPSLTELACKLEGSVVSDERWNAADASWFPSLKVLVLKLSPLQPSFPLSFFHAISASQVQKLIIELENNQDHSSAEILLLLFQAVGRLPALTYFRLSSPIYSEGDGWETHVIDLSILRHLFAAPLRTLDISRTPFRLDDSSVRVIGWALPNLEILRLGDASEYASSTITYPGLVAIVTSCPKLKDIGLQVDLSGLTEADVTAARHPVSFSVELVSVAGIRVTDPIRTAAALFLAFPCVRVRDFSASSSSHGVKASWKQVNQHLDLHREQQTQKATVADAATDLPLAP